jgi:uncharacterized protein with GYD domain
MPTYISLLRYTQKGLESMKDGPARVDAAKQAFKAMGAEMKAFYLTMGQYDAVVIAEGPDDETMTKLAMSIGAGGNIRTESYRAFTEDEFRKIAAALP